MEASKALRKARRQLEDIEGYELLSDLSWDWQLKKWTFKFRLTGSYIETSSVPVITDWHCIVSPNYPYGSIEINPDAKQGIHSTFPHMQYNAPIDGREWLDGNICVKTAYGSWGKTFFNNEPYTDERLYWNIKRSQAWVEAAANGQLTQSGDPFEFPHFPRTGLPIILFIENEETYKVWQKTEAQNGFVSFQVSNINEKAFCITKFESKGQEILSFEWGSVLKKSKTAENTAMWYRLPSIPILDPWEVPLTWKGLFQVTKELGADLESWLIQQLGIKHEIKKLNLLFLGFPVPEKFGEDSKQMHWFVFQFSYHEKINGFRSNSKDEFRTRTKLSFQKYSKISWAMSENWSQDQITSRGVMKQELRNMKVALIGCGAIGSALSELLIRLALINMQVIDDDFAMIGNYSRHTLTMTSIFKNKAESLAKHLNSIFPFTSVSFNKDNLKNILQKDENYLNSFDLVIDATGSDEALDILNSTLLNKKVIFISLSTSIDAKHLYCFMIRCDKGEIMTSFGELMAPWVETQKLGNLEVNFPLEGIGCWHPIFPARLDDIWSILSPSIKQIEDFVTSDEARLLVVVERHSDSSVKIHKTK